MPKQNGNPKILAAGAAVQLLTGIPAAWGVFQKPVMAQYGFSRGQAMLSFAILVAGYGIGCAIGGFVQDQHGPRYAALWGTALLGGGSMGAALVPQGNAALFFLVYSIPAGVGSAFLAPAVLACAQKWYQDKKGWATGVAGVANVYTLADIKAATKDSSVNTIRLMNDIDASKEAYEFDEPQRFDAPAFCRSDIRQGVVFDGNGHTIYNLKSGLWRFNSGTIQNLNISIHDTESDSKHLSDFGAGTSGIEYFGVVRDNQGVIENCNVTMQIDLTVSYEPQIGGIALFNADPYNVNNGKVGVIRDCIANLNINIDTTGARETSLISGISRSSNDGAGQFHDLDLQQLQRPHQPG